jgi:beta-glucanase (GH16 family)
MKFSIIASTLLSTLSIVAADSYTPQKCSASSHCPEEYPCCSNDGTCGTGSYCLGPCDPRYSFNSSSCMPAPICKSGTYTPRTDNMMAQLDFLGNTSSTDFIYYGEIEDQDNSVILKMPAHSVGGTISSTFYVWYGKISFKFKTSHNQGVVSAGILFSQVQDEIDYEFVGSQLDIAESNYYFEGIPNYTHSSNLATTDTYENWHTYTIDWSEDSITWGIDGNNLRTLKKSDTLNSTSNIYEYPQTPSRIQFSIWPAGDPTINAPGTVEWAGGDIDWSAQDFTDPGYLYVALDTVEVECYSVPSDAKTEGKNQVSYIYDGAGFLHENVIVSDKQTWMKNLGGTGFNTGEDSNDSSSSSSSNASSKAPSSSNASSKAASSSSSSSSSSTSSNKPSSIIHTSTTASSSTSSSSSVSIVIDVTSTTSSPKKTTSSSSTSSSTASSTSSGSGFVQFISSSVPSSNMATTNSPFLLLIMTIASQFFYF